jgi:hypothetical protein
MPARNLESTFHRPFEGIGLVPYPFSNFGAGRSPKKWVLSGQVNSIIDVRWHSSLPSPFGAYPKENPVPLGREYLNRTNRPREYLSFGTKQFELGSVN